MGDRPPGTWWCQGNVTEDCVSSQFDVHEAAQARARAEGRSVSDLARAAMELYLSTLTRRPRTTARRPLAMRAKARSNEPM